MSLQEKIEPLSSADIEELIARGGASDGDEPQPGYQASIHAVSVDGQALIVKSVARERRLIWLRRRMLRNEYRVYRKLQGIAGTPRCYGLIDGQYLLLEHIGGTAFRNLEFAKDDPVHQRLLELIERLHECGIAHADLKRRDNLILSHDGMPFIVDFGTAIVRKSGFRPLNHFFFRVAKQLDYHGWFKNKYRDRSLPFDPDDSKYYRPMRLERAARWIRRTLRKPLDLLRERALR